MLAQQSINTVLAVYNVSAGEICSVSHQLLLYNSLEFSGFFFDILTTQIHPGCTTKLFVRSCGTDCQHLSSFVSKQVSYM